MAVITATDVALCILGLCILKFAFAPSKRKNLPPGPKPFPLVGNLLDLPKEYDWLHWAKHKALYGPISSVSVFGQTMILINDAQIAYDLLEKKSSIYSDRPSLVFAGEMCGWADGLALLHYGPRFRAHRKNISHIIGTKNAVAQFYPLVEVETRRFLSRVLAQPDMLHSYIRKLAGAIILKISHGYTIDPTGNDPLVDLADDALLQFSLAATPGAWLVDLVPILRYIPDWMPGAGFKRTAKKWYQTVKDLTDKPHAFVRRQMASGNAIPSYSSALLEMNPDAEGEFIIKWSAQALYAGGADTTVSALYGFYLAMVLNPEVQKRGQAELDAVVGPDRLPSYEDRSSLPYIEAIVKEVLRWNPVGPMGLPHVSTDDDVYKGYEIPKGSILMANIWQFTHDPVTYHQPFEFKPERFLSAQPERDPHTLSFGFGRRICPGKELADSSVFLGIAMSLAAFNITKARDERGVEIIPECEFTTGIISHPKPFRCTITPRSDKVAALVRSADEEYPVLENDAAILKEL
ncbi:cytochrome P450 [Rickenella mellea]|uniref:Cytochrome P450 n=1 Tax=Rickenella mellea TaxID=50990 RepID=A0A4Y7PZN3_9AGAM|nr:cytochrome P450 [Rickenella mellea]